jgi:ABC-type multidrug transport system permease subunit
MKEKWKNLLLAIAAASLLTFFSALQKGRIYESNTGEPPSVATISIIIIGFLGSISILTILFYFVIEYIRKKKE